MILVTTAATALSNFADILVELKGQKKPLWEQVKHNAKENVLVFKSVNAC